MTQKVDQAIPAQLINTLDDLRCRLGVSLPDAIKLLREALIPCGYKCYPFRAGTDQCFVDMLRSLVATLRFRHTVGLYKSEDVDFSLYLYTYT